MELNAKKPNGAVAAMSLLFISCGLRLVNFAMLHLIGPQSEIIFSFGIANILSTILILAGTVLLALYAGRRSNTALVLCGCGLSIAYSLISITLSYEYLAMLDLLLYAAEILSLVLLAINHKPRNMAVSVIITLLSAVCVLYAFRSLYFSIDSIINYPGRYTWLYIANTAIAVSRITYYVAISVLALTHRADHESAPHVISAMPKAGYHAPQVMPQYLDLENELLKLKQQHDAGQLPEEEYARRRAALLSRM